MVELNTARAQPRGWWGVVLCTALFISAAYAWASWNHQFVYDDFLNIAHAQPLDELSDFTALFTQKGVASMPYYRPLSRLSLLLQKTFHGNNPRPIHLGNSFLAGSVLIAAYALLRRRSMNIQPVPALLAATLLAAHPLMSSCVYPAASGRETLQPALLILLSMWAYLGSGTWMFLLALVTFTMSLLSKELAIVLPVMFVLADVLRLSGQPRNVRACAARYAGVAAIAIIYLMIRHALYGGADLHAKPSSHMLLPLWSYLFAIQSIFMPEIDLAYEPPLNTWFSWPRTIVGLLCVISISIATTRTWRYIGPVVVFWFGWFVMMQLLTANLFWQEAPFAERYVVVAMLGLFAIVAASLSTHWHRPKVRVASVTVALTLIVASFAISLHLAKYYENESAFFEQWARTSPHHAPAQFNFAAVLQERGDIDGAIEHYTRAHIADPADKHTLMRLARLFSRRNQSEQATTHLQRLLAMDSDHVEALTLLAHQMQIQQQWLVAGDLYERALRLQPDHADALSGYGTLLVRQRQIDQAIHHFERALRIQPENPDHLFNLALAKVHTGESKQAMELLERAVERSPRDVSMRTVLAELYVKSGRLDKASEQLREALTIAHDLGDSTLAAQLRQRLQQYNTPLTPTPP